MVERVPVCPFLYINKVRRYYIVERWEIKFQELAKCNTEENSN
jgi:hypothetical protein